MPGDFFCGIEASTSQTLVLDFCQEKAQGGAVPQGSIRDGNQGKVKDESVNVALSILNRHHPRPASMLFKLFRMVDRVRIRANYAVWGMVRSDYTCDFSKICGQLQVN